MQQPFSHYQVYINKRTTSRKCLLPKIRLTVNRRRRRRVKRFPQIVLMPSFWNTIDHSLKVTGVLADLLQMVNGKKKKNPWDTFTRPLQRVLMTININIKRSLKSLIGGGKFNSITLCMQPGTSWTQDFFYANPPIIEQDEKIMRGLQKCIERLVPNISKQWAIKERVSSV